MPRTVFFLATLLCVWGPAARADETAVATQKKTAEENWASLEAGPFAHAETDHLLVYAPKAYEKKIKDTAASLEKAFELAVKALQFEAREQPLEGKLAVYLFPERDLCTTFVRRVQKRRLEAEDAGSFLLEPPAPHVAAGPSRNKKDFGVEEQAAVQVGAALLQHRAGRTVPLPDWVTSGFGRATVYRSMPADKMVRAEKALAAKLVRVRTAMDVWGTQLKPDEALVLQGSLMDYLGYGPVASKLVKFLEGFKPEDNLPKKTVAQALEAADITPAALDAKWRAWAATGK